MSQIDYYVPAGYPSLGMRHFLGGGFKLYFIIASTWVKMIQFDEHIFFQRGGSTTNYQLMVNWWLGARWFRIRIGVPLSNNP